MEHYRVEKRYSMWNDRPPCEEMVKEIYCKKNNPETVLRGSRKLLDMEKLVVTAHTFNSHRYEPSIHDIVASGKGIIRHDDGRMFLEFHIFEDYKLMFNKLPCESWTVAPVVARRDGDPKNDELLRFEVFALDAIRGMRLGGGFGHP